MTREEAVTRLLIAAETLVDAIDCQDPDRELTGLADELRAAIVDVEAAPR